MKKIDEFDIERLKLIAKALHNAAAEAENASLKTYNESNPAFEFGFLKGYVEDLGMQIEAIVGDK
jgi:hypothetical protein